MITLAVRRSGPSDEQVDAALFAQLNRTLTRRMVFLKADLQKKLVENDSIATGQLRRSISAGTEQLPDALYGWLGLELYWPYVEFGRKPGNMPPITTPEGGGILRWVVAKKLVRNKETAAQAGFKLPSGRVSGAIDGGTGEDAIDEQLVKMERQVAWAVAKAIERNGVKARPFVEPVLEDHWDRIVADLDAALAGEP